MPNGYTDDMGQDSYDDDFQDNEIWDTDAYQIENWNDGYTSLDGVNARLMENQISPN